MTIPTTPFGILAVVALLLPGIIFAAVRTSMQGFLAQDRNIGGRIIQALMISIILDAIYLDPVLVGLLALGLAVLFPALCAYVTYGRANWTKATSSWARRIVAPLVKNVRPNTQYRSVPTAWDWIAGQQGDKWVRVLNAQGHWIGGWFSE
jgi:hypothetical protein